jgi:hypothetical protein
MGGRWRWSAGERAAEVKEVVKEVATTRTLRA